jgi:hypothetical protein
MPIESIGSTNSFKVNLRHGPAGIAWLRSSCLAAQVLCRVLPKKGHLQLKGALVLGGFPELNDPDYRKSNRIRPRFHGRRNVKDYAARESSN